MSTVVELATTSEIVTGTNGYHSVVGEESATPHDLFAQCVNEGTLRQYKLGRNDVAVASALLPGFDPQFPSAATGEQLIGVIKEVNPPGASYYWDQSIRQALRKLTPLLAESGLRVGIESDGRSFERNLYWIETIPPEPPPVIAASAPLKEKGFTPAVEDPVAEPGEEIKVVYNGRPLEAKEKFQERMQKVAYQASVIDLSERIFTSFGINAICGSRIESAQKVSLPESVAVLVVALPREHRSLLFAMPLYKDNPKLLYDSLLRDAVNYAGEISRVPDNHLKERDYSIKQHYLLTVAGEASGEVPIAKKQEEGAEHINATLNRVFALFSADEIRNSEREVRRKIARYFRGEYNLGTLKSLHLSPDDTPEDIEKKIAIAKAKRQTTHRSRSPSHGKLRL